MRTISWLLAVLCLTGCSFTPRERAVAEKCSDVTAVLKNTHEWMLIGVVNSKHESRASIHPSQSGLSWQAAGQAESVTLDQAASRVVQELDGKPGQLMMHYLGQPRRGYYLIDLDAQGKVTAVEDYHWAD